MNTQNKNEEAPKSAVSALQWRGTMLVLFFVYVLNFLDRQIINILAEQIKHDLQLADWQLGLLTGFAFALFYALAGIPIARYAERGNRKGIIGIAVALWSGFTVLCGLAGSYVQLLLCRFGVGIGEAGGVPPAHSLITEITPKEKRASAMAFFHLGLPIGTLLGLAFGGLVADSYGWRTAFILAGAPGIIVALLVFFVLPEPRKAMGGSNPESSGVSLAATLAYLIKKPTYVFAVAGATLAAFTTYSQQAFVPAFFFRVHGAELNELASGFDLKAGGFLGISLGLASGLAGALGVWFGGKLADLGGKRDLKYYGLVPAIATLIFIPIQITAYLVSSTSLSLIIFAPSILLLSMWIAPFQATVQSVAPAHMRATASAVGLLVMNLVGLGLGPVILGVLSDTLSVQGGLGPVEGLRWALVICAFMAMASAFMFFKAGSTVQRDIEE